jgi:hypothetical protein
MNPTATKDHMEKISDHTSRRRGGLHTQDLLNHHTGLYRKDCLLCNPPKEFKPATAQENSDGRARMD